MLSTFEPTEHVTMESKREESDRRTTERHERKREIKDFGIIRCSSPVGFKLALKNQSLFHFEAK